MSTEYFSVPRLGSVCIREPRGAPGHAKSQGWGGSWAALLQPVFEARIMYRVGSPATLDDINLSCGRRRVKHDFRGRHHYEVKVQRPECTRVMYVGTPTLRNQIRAYQCYTVTVSDGFQH